MTEHDAKGLEIIAGWLQRDGLVEPAAMLRRLAAGASEGQAVIDCGECACLPGICDKEEALKPAGYVIPQRLQSDDPVISLYRKPEGGARKPLYTHPSAELTALRERVAGIRMEALKEARHVVYMALSLNDAFKSIEALVDKESQQ